jgi:hypothetical protein
MNSVLTWGVVTDGDGDGEAGSAKGLHSVLGHGFWGWMALWGLY